MTIKLYDIVYDTDGYGVDLPEEIVTTLEEMDYDVELNGLDISEFVSMNGADFISDETGFLVCSFSFEILK
jgi:hypothetical protein